MIPRSSGPSRCRRFLLCGCSKRTCCISFLLIIALAALFYLQIIPLPATTHAAINSMQATFTHTATQVKSYIHTQTAPNAATSTSASTSTSATTATTATSATTAAATTDVVTSTRDGIRKIKSKIITTQPDHATTSSTNSIASTNDDMMTTTTAATTTTSTSTAATAATATRRVKRVSTTPYTTTTQTVAPTYTEEHEIDDSQRQIEEAEYATAAAEAAETSQPVSIVLVNHQEPYLVATVESILSTPSQELIHEVLIIDDMSEPPVTYDMFPSADSRIRIVRPNERLGLIKARVLGGNTAQGPFMVLLDAHVKPHDNWLQPIVNLLREDWKRILNMQVGLLNATAWQQMDPSAIGSKAAFTWKLDHFWEGEFTKEQLIAQGDPEPDPDISPITMGMFATTKSWWSFIGGMDNDLAIWGGENIEISLRTWLCGGEIRVARGSFVDHAFRTSFPYHVDPKLYNRNIVRIVEAWFDEPSKKRFYSSANITPGSIDVGSLEDVQEIQRRLACRPFSWYLKRFVNRSPVDRN